MNLLAKSAGSLLVVLVSGSAIAAYRSTTAFQMGFPGVGMEVINTREQVAQRFDANVVPPPLPPASQEGQLAVDAYKNVQVLGHVSSGEFTRLMTAMTLWVAPDNGCGYCHAPERDAKGSIVKDEDGRPLADANNMQSDELYTKRVARRMLQMTMRINGDWKEHVKATGVTCYTCHRGNPVPTNIWFDEPEAATRSQGIPGPVGPSGPSSITGLASLPRGALRPYLAGNEEIRVQATEAMGSSDRSSIKQAEWTYALMLHMSSSLGVNCTYCHNSRSLGEWSTSPATRTTAWYGIRMVRELNKDYLEPLADVLPPARHGALGDGPKLSCATCHQGAYRPLLGVSMLPDYAPLAEAKPQPEKTPPPPPASPAEGSADGGASTPADATTDGGAATKPAPLLSDGGSASKGVEAIPGAGAAADAGSVAPPTRSSPSTVKPGIPSPGSSSSTPPATTSVHP